jgi:hypothetical protein
MVSRVKPRQNPDSLLYFFIFLIFILFQIFLKLISLGLSEIWRGLAGPTILAWFWRGLGVVWRGFV